MIARHLSIALLTFISSIAVYQHSWASCAILGRTSESATQINDSLAKLLISADSCPQDVFALRHQLKQAGLKLEATMVANRGFHNPSQGSFSIFEIVSGQLKLNNVTLDIHAGDFFFGHFTDINSTDQLIADQNTSKNSLMIEALAWDPTKKVFNFYELRGDGKQGQWFYRGDSTDIAADNQSLHRQPNSQRPQFGNRLRCSACHGAGGPIMKELSAPHNDWWESTRKLDFGGRQPDAALRDILTTLVPADRLAASVNAGLKKVQKNKSTNHPSEQSLQELLRPLFCPIELNFQSDTFPNQDKAAEVAIPTEFFIDSRLLPEAGKYSIAITRNHYELALNALGSHFPETNLNDADHAWLTPVKAVSDKIAVDSLIKQGIIDTKFMFDVLDIDMTNPVLSKTRCALLRFIPDTHTTNWRDIFIRNLSLSSEPAAKKLIHNMSTQTNTPADYQQKAAAFINQCRVKLNNSKNIEKMYLLLTQRRAEIRTSEISANPRGQILEPGFRVIFPESQISSAPGKLILTPECDVVESR